MKNDNNWLPSPESGNSLSKFYKIWLNIANEGNVNIHNSEVCGHLLHRRGKLIKTKIYVLSY